MDEIRVGLIGAGRIGKVHAANIAYRVPGASLVAVADVFFDAAQACADDFGASAYASLTEMVEAESLDAVVICSATNTHAALIEEAAGHGKHIFCEKPIDFDLGRIDRALAAVDEAGVKLQIGFNRRFDPNAERMKRAVESGEIGKPHLMHIVSRDPAPPPPAYIKTSGGLFVDMTIHDFDMARFLMGCEATEIFTAADVLIDERIRALGDVDTAVITLRFENSAIGTIDNSRQAVYGYDQRMEVFGSKGSIHSENSFPNRTIVRNDLGIHRDLPLHFFIERYAESFEREMNAFMEAIRNNTLPMVTGWDGRMPVVMGLAAKRSAEENRPVRLDEFG